MFQVERGDKCSEEEKNMVKMMGRLAKIAEIRQKHNIHLRHHLIDRLDLALNSMVDHNKFNKSFILDNSKHVCKVEVIFT